MELNFDRYTGWFNKNIAFGDISVSLSFAPNQDWPSQRFIEHQNYNNEGGHSYVGPCDNGIYEFIPVSFYNAWAQLYEDIRYAGEDNSLVYRNDNMVVWKFDSWNYMQVRLPKESFHAHGQRWNSLSFTFPREIAHPYLDGSFYTNLQSIGLARPHVVGFNRKYKKDDSYINYYMFDPGPTSLAYFFNRCERMNYGINLYDFTPEWNGQFWHETEQHTFETDNLSSLSWFFSSNDKHDQLFSAAYNVFYVHKLPMIIGSEYPNGMLIPWLKNISSMFANNGLATYRHRIEIPCFIESAKGLFCDTNQRELTNSANFNFDFNYNAINVGVKTDDGISVECLRLDVSEMFMACRCHESLANSFVYNGNMLDNTIILPERVINTVRMFENCGYNFNIHFSSECIPDTSNMFRYAGMFNGNVNWHNFIGIREWTELKPELGNIETFTNNAAYMFYGTYNFNRPTYIPYFGINDAIGMFCWSGNRVSQNPSLQVKVDPDANNFVSEGTNAFERDMIYALEFDWENHSLNEYRNEHFDLNTCDIYIPSGTNYTQSMFELAKFKTINTIYLDNESCLSANSMFRMSDNINANIYVGKNVGSIACNEIFGASLNINKKLDGWMYFGENSLNKDGWPGRLGEGAGFINVRYMTFDGCGLNKHVQLFNGYNVNVYSMVFNNAWSNEVDGYGQLFYPRYGGTYIEIDRLALLNGSLPNSRQLFASRGNTNKINRLDILDASAVTSMEMFRDSNYTFQNGINISADSCIYAWCMFANCQHMILNRSWADNGKIFIGDPNLSLHSTFYGCTNLWNHNPPTIYEMPSEANTAEQMFAHAAIYGLDTASLAAMNCYNLRGTFLNCHINAIVNGGIEFNENTVALQDVFRDAVIDSGWNGSVKVMCNTWYRPYGGLGSYYNMLVNMHPHPTNVYIRNCYTMMYDFIWDRTISVTNDDSIGINITFGSDSPCDAYRGMQHVVNHNGDPVRADQARGVKYRYNYSSGNSQEWYWEQVSSSDTLEIPDINNPAAWHYINKPYPIYSEHFYYYKTTDYADIPIPNSNSTINQPLTLYIYDGTFFRNTFYNVNVYWDGNY